MKTLLTLIFILLCVTTRADETPQTFTTKDGKTYTAVVISATNPDSITVQTDSGVENIPVANLPADLYKSLGYAKADADKKAAADLAAKDKAEADAADTKARDEQLGIMPMLDATKYPPELKDIIAKHNEKRGAINYDLRHGKLGGAEQVHLEYGAKDYDAYAKYIATVTDKDELAKIQDAVKQGKIYYGMREEVFLAIKGEADKVNATGSDNHLSEQLVYGDSFYYFENSILTTIQN